MKKKLPKFYWDTSIFLMVLTERTCHGPGVLDAAREILRKTELGEAVIITSEITVAEILPSYEVPPDQFDRYEAWLQWHHLEVRAVDHPVSRLAAQIRSRLIRMEPPHRPKLPDVLHVATAFLYEDQISAVHSVDDKFPKVLEWLDDGLLACKPQLPQLAMDGLFNQGDAHPQGEG